MGLFSFGNKKKSHGARSGQYGGWGITSAWFLAKNSWSKLSNFSTNFASTRAMPKSLVKIEWHEPIDIFRSSATSLLTIDQYYFLHFMNVFVCCWRARATCTIFIVHIFSALGKHFVPSINVASVQGSFTICHSQHSECVRALNFVFHTKFENMSHKNFSIAYFCAEAHFINIANFVWNSTWFRQTLINIFETIGSYRNLGNW